MKRYLLIPVIIAGFGALHTDVRSQDAAPAPVPALAPAAPVSKGPPLEMLKAIKAANDKLLEQQAATLKKLDEMEKVSQTLKILGKRS